MDLHKMKGKLGASTIEEMNAMDENELHKVVVEAESAMKQVKDELEGNEAYQRAKADVGHLSQGKKDVDKRQKGRIAYALHRLEELGKMDVIARHDWLQAALKVKAKLATEAAKAKAELERRKEEEAIEAREADAFDNEEEAAE